MLIPIFYLHSRNLFPVLVTCEGGRYRGVSTEMWIDRFLDHNVVAVSSVPWKRKIERRKQVSQRIADGNYEMFTSVSKKNC